MKLIPRPTFVTNTGRILSFVRSGEAPGFTHRVVIDGRAVDWLSGGKRADAKNARFFFEKHPPAVAT